MTRLLLVDDDVESMAVVRARLADDGIEILCATGGRAGLEAAKSQDPDLILLDLDMPDMTGFDVCRRLKADPQVCMIPILFLSGSGTSADKVRGLDLVPSITSQSRSTTSNSGPESERRSGPNASRTSLSSMRTSIH